MKKSARQSRMLRKKRVRAKINGTAARPRVSIFRSNSGLFVQIVDDAGQKTLVSGSTRELQSQKKNKGTKSDQAKELGVLIAKRAGEKKIKTVIFDRNGYRYHGRVKAFAESLREGGIQC